MMTIIAAKILLSICLGNMIRVVTCQPTTTEGESTPPNLPSSRIELGFQQLMRETSKTSDRTNITGVKLLQQLKRVEGAVEQMWQEISSIKRELQERPTREDLVDEASAIRRDFNGLRVELSSNFTTAEQSAQANSEEIASIAEQLRRATATQVEIGHVLGGLPQVLRNQTNLLEDKFQVLTGFVIDSVQSNLTTQLALSFVRQEKDLQSLNSRHNDSLSLLHQTMQLQTQLTGRIVEIYNNLTEFHRQNNHESRDSYSSLRDLIQNRAQLVENSQRQMKDVLVQTIGRTIQESSSNLMVNILHSGVALAVLVAGPSVGEGRLMVRRYTTSEWGTVCDDGFDNADATVACFMMGFGRVGRVMENRNHYGAGLGSIHLDDLTCAGTEDSLWQCGNQGYKVHNCGHGEDVSISCL